VPPFRSFYDAFTAGWQKLRFAAKVSAACTLSYLPPGQGGGLMKESIFYTGCYFHQIIIRSQKPFFRTPA